MFYGKEQRNAIVKYVDKEIEMLRNRLRMREPEKASAIMQSTKDVSFEYLIRELYREVFNQRGSRGFSHHVSLKDKLKEEFQHELNLRNEQIDKLSKELKKLKAIVREVTDHVYGDDNE